MDLHELTATQAAQLIRRRELSPVDLVQALLRRIDVLEPSILAWETLDREGALAVAKQCEARVGREGAGPLLGVPMGIKDILYTAGLRTTSGSPLFKDFVPNHDATSVALLRKAGAVILGKTVTVQFAHFDPPATRNPWNRERTPGGSSSGSAAAVAARMVPVALGTQTGGSILRPAAYCGVVGLKPTYGRVSRFGVMPASWSLDHVGALARSVEDVALLLQVMAGHDPLDAASSRAPVRDYVAAAKRREKAPVIGLLLDSMEGTQPEVIEHARQVATALERAGAQVREVHLPLPMQDIVATRAVISDVEAAGLHAHSLLGHPEGYAPKLTAQLQVSQLIPGVAYIQAQRLRRKLRPQVEKMFDGIDSILAPTTSDVAPDLGTTGRSHYQALWSLFGFPSITLPSGLSREGLPLAIQLVASPFQEEKLLSAAAWAEAQLDPMPSPLP